MDKTFNIRLPEFFNIVRLFALAVIILFAAVIYYFPEYFTHVLDRNLLVIFLVFLTVWNVFFYILIAPFVGRKAVLYANNISWSIFMVGVIYTTGGIYSPLIIILIFPIITTAFDLEAQAARIMGGFIAVLFIAQALIDTRFPHTKSYFSLTLTELLFLGVATYYVYVIIKEILRQKYEKEKTAREYSDLLEVDKAKTEFITIASHQLRTPLSELKWAVATLEEDKTIPDASRQLIDRTKGSVEKVLKVADSILLASEQTQDRFKHQLVAYDLAALLKDIVNDLKPMAKRKNVNLQFNSSPEKIIIPMNVEKMHFAFNNIIDNGIRYSPNGNVAIDVALKNGSEVLVKIADNGIGIPEEEQKRIFTKLFRARNAILLEPNETGLGLFIAKNTIERHGGKIWFESKEKMGTTFFVVLPQK